MADTIEYPSHEDFEWFACDRDGFVAVFTSAGIAPIPLSVLQNRTAHDILCATLRTLPATGRGELLVDLPRPDDFVFFSSRGLFAYDWSDVHRVRELTGAYELLAQPECPLRMGDIPPNERGAVELTRLAIAFKSTGVIHPSLLGSIVDP